MDPREKTSDQNSAMNLEQEIQGIRDCLDDIDEHEPPAMLDQAVLNTARRELANGKRRPIRWLGAFATATVLVLAVTLVVQQEPAQVSPDAGRDIDAEYSLKKESLPETRTRTEGDEISELKANENRRQRSNEASKATAAKLQTTSARSEEMQSAPIPAPPPEPGKRDFDDANRGEIVNDPVVELEEAMSQDAPRQDDSEVWQDEPRQWIDRMLTLKQDSELDKLQIELEAFRKAFPDYPLPAELVD